ncbi:MAG: MFS transporter [Anaerolineae bacterium]|nr:MFS transporter [Thermoflexales bacterium]MDW8407773.1 MFS transporter [Anaerolineae bacterium]
MQQTSVDYSRKWHALTAVAISIFLATLDGSIVNVALPTLVRQLDTDFATVQWVVLAYLLTMATLMLGIGRLADMHGKKPIFVAGFVVFTIGSVLCGLSPSVHALIAFRVLQAVGAAMTLAIGPAITTEAFPPHERGKALGISGTVVSLGSITGPTLGGLILNALDWHWIFFVNLPVGILGAWIALRFVPHLRPIGRQRFDLGGAASLFLSMLSFLLALTFGQQGGFGNPLVLGLLAAFVGFLALFITIERRTSQPMVDLRLFNNPLFSVSLITGFLTFVTAAGSFLIMPFYLQNVLGYSAGQTGLLMSIVPIMLGMAAPIAGSLSDRLGSRTITVIGMGVLVVAYFSMSTLTEDTSAVGVVVRLLPLGLGMGIFQSPNNSAIMGSVPRERLGIASGFMSLTRTLGQTTGSALLGALWAMSVMGHAGARLLQGATSAPPATQAAALHDTFLVAVSLVLIGLALTIWGFRQERRQQIMQRALGTE